MGLRELRNVLEHESADADRDRRVALLSAIDVINREYASARERIPQAHGVRQAVLFRAAGRP